MLRILVSCFLFYNTLASLSFASSQPEIDESEERPYKMRRIDPSPPSLRRQSSALDAPIPNKRTLSGFSQSLSEDPMIIENQKGNPDLSYTEVFELSVIPIDMLNKLIRLEGMAKIFHSLCKYFEIQRRTDHTLNQKIIIPTEEGLIEYLKNDLSFLFVHVQISFCSTNLQREALTEKTPQLYSLGLRGFINNKLDGSWLKHARNLQVLDLRYSTTDVDLSPLTCLPALGTLDLSESTVDLSNMNVSRLTTLHTLILSHIRTNGGKPVFIPNFNALSNLQNLNLARSNFRDTASLASFPQLRILDISGYAMTLNFTFLSFLTKLECLHVERNGFTDEHFTHIASLMNLNELWMSGKYLSDEDGESIHKAYTHLNIYFS